MDVSYHDEQGILNIPTAKFPEDQSTVYNHQQTKIIEGKTEGSSPENPICLEDDPVTPPILLSSENADQFGVRLRNDDDSALEDFIDINGPESQVDINVDETGVYGDVTPYIHGSVTYSENVESLAEKYVSDPTIFKAETTGLVTMRELCCSGNQFDEPYVYQKMSNLGAGSYGEVSLNQSSLTGSQFVTKKIYDNKFDVGEIYALNKLKNENIVSLRGLVIRYGVPEILLEYAGITLTQYVRSGIDDRTIITLTLQALSAIKHLDDNRLLNPDMKPDNFCVLDNNGVKTLKMIDLGSCQDLNKGVRYDVGWTPEYMAPEASALFLVMKRFLDPQILRHYGTSTLNGQYHIFVLGLIIFYMKTQQNILEFIATNGRRYAGMDPASVKKAQGDLIMFMATNPGGVKGFIQKDWIPPLKGILHIMVEGIPQNRPDAALCHKILNDLTTTFYAPNKRDESLKSRVTRTRLRQKLVGKHSPLNVINPVKEVVKETAAPKPPRKENVVPDFSQLMRMDSSDSA